MRYVGLRIYNNCDWRAILRRLEKNNYTWASGDRPTRLYFNMEEGTVYIDPIRKILAISGITGLYEGCSYYIVVK